MLFTCTPARHADRRAVSRARGIVAASGSRSTSTATSISTRRTRWCKPFWNPERDATMKFANDRTREVQAAADGADAQPAHLGRAAPRRHGHHGHRHAGDLAGAGADVLLDRARSRARHGADGQRQHRRHRRPPPRPLRRDGHDPVPGARTGDPELERITESLGFRGIEISSNVDGTDFSDPKFRPIFQRCEELGVVLFMHPSGFTDGRRFGDHYFSNVIGIPLESTIAVHHLIFGGVLDAYPGLKLVVAHGGGYLPAYSGRIDHGASARPGLLRASEGRPDHLSEAAAFRHDGVHPPPARIPGAGNTAPTMC